MICQYKTIRTDERAGTAVVEANAGKADMVEPFLRRREIIFFLQQLRGRIVECPHTVVCECRHNEAATECGGKNNE